MKKTILLATLLTLGYSACALSANPFMDVPTGHWAYASLDALSEKGIIDGYPDGTFKGSRNMTRYEMSQIVAKALAKGTISENDNLVGEFSDELNSLGVRVSKLEKKKDNFKIYGEMDFNYKDDRVNNIDRGEENPIDYQGYIQTYLFFEGPINDEWKYVGMIDDRRDISGMSPRLPTELQQAYIEGNIGNVTVTAGRYSNYLSEGNIHDNYSNAIKLTMGKKWQVVLEGGKLDTSQYEMADRYYRVGVTRDFGKYNICSDYLYAQDVNTMGMEKTTDKVWSLGTHFLPFEKWDIGLLYMKSSNDDIKKAGGSENSYVASLTYGMAEPDKPNSYSLYGKYYNQGAGSVIAHTMSGCADYFPTYGFKGYLLGGKYTMAKNIIGTFEYYHLNSKKDSNQSAHTLWSQIAVTF